MGKTYDGRRGGINAIAPVAARRSGNSMGASQHSS